MARQPHFTLSDMFLFFFPHFRVQGSENKKYALIYTFNPILKGVSTLSKRSYISKCVVQNEFRKVTRLVPIFVIEMHYQTGYKCLPKLVQTGN